METKHWDSMFKKCPFCSNDYFLAGPCGGLSQNFKCRNCGAKFNNMGPFGIDLLSTPEKTPNMPTTAVKEEDESRA